jgi:fucose permease
MTKGRSSEIVPAKMKADRNLRETGGRLPCREHPALCLSLFAFMFIPAVVGEVALGRWLTQFMPHPGLIAMLCFAPAIVVLFVIGMLIGATIWLLLMKRFVPQNLLATFFLGGPHVPAFSNLCSKIFAWSYGQNRPKPEV